MDRTKPRVSDQVATRDDADRVQRPDPSGTVRTLREVAAAFNTSYQTVRQSWRANRMPGVNGKWDLAEIAIWKRSRLRDPAQKGPADDTRAIQRSRLEIELRCRQEDLAAKARENQRAQGDMVSRDDVNREVGEIFANIRHQLQRLPAILQPFFPVDQQIELAQETRNQINNILRTLATWRPGREGLESK
jgi:hypothetical protein